MIGEPIYSTMRRRKRKVLAAAAVRHSPSPTVAALLMLLFQTSESFVSLPSHAAISEPRGSHSNNYHHVARFSSYFRTCNKHTTSGVRKARLNMTRVETQAGVESQEKTTQRTVPNDQEWQFFDTARINVKAGDGGDGCVAMRREYCIEYGGPNGGSGGRGGSILLRCVGGLNTLAAVRNKVHHRAENGQNGKGKSRTGISGSEVYIPVPVGTVVRDQDGTLCGELTVAGEELLVARGGRGGRGNEAFKTNRVKTPKLSEKGEPGAERWLSLELKLVADVGFVGVPNAGKSTLLAVCSNAKPKIADYPFTTVTPNLGVCDVLGDEGDLGKGLVLADIPGLLEGAHSGVGLGLAFLRHVQRCRVLVHLVSGDSLDPLGDYRAIQHELELFSPKLLEKKQVVVLNKIDLPHVKSKQAELEATIKVELGHTRFISISAVKGENTQELMRRLYKLVSSLPPVDDLFDGEAVRELDSPAAEDTGFDIEVDPNYPGQFRVTGERIVRVARMTNWDYYEAVQRFQRILDAMGINEALRQRGARKGDLVMIDEWDFDYSPESTSVYLSGLGLGLQDED